MKYLDFGNFLFNIFYFFFGFFGFFGFFFLFWVFFKSKMLSGPNSGFVYFVFSSKEKNESLLVEPKSSERSFY